MAVSAPVELTVPTLELPFRTPLTDHVTLLSGLPVLLRVPISWSVPLVCTAFPEALWTLTEMSLVTLTDALALLVGSA